VEDKKGQNSHILQPILLEISYLNIWNMLSQMSAMLKVEFNILMDVGLFLLHNLFERHTQQTKVADF
jgi:hypothetical protein